MAAQLIACHNASMECYRRAMIGEQTFEGRRENLARPTSSPAPTPPCSKRSTVIAARVSSGSRWSTFTFTKAARPSSATSPTRGVGARRNQRINPMHRTRLGHAPGTEMPSQIEAEREAVPVAGGEG